VGFDIIVPNESTKVKVISQQYRGYIKILKYNNNSEFDSKDYDYYDIATDNDYNYDIATDKLQLRYIATDNDYYDIATDNDYYDIATDNLTGVTMT
jgi:hypothetical protein